MLWLQPDGRPQTHRPRGAGRRRRIHGAFVRTLAGILPILPPSRRPARRTPGPRRQRDPARPANRSPSEAAPARRRRPHRSPTPTPKKTSTDRPSACSLPRGPRPPRSIEPLVMRMIRFNPHNRLIRIAWSPRSQRGGPRGAAGLCGDGVGRARPAPPTSCKCVRRRDERTCRQPTFNCARM